MVTGKETLLKENPNMGDWWALMEEKYGNERAPYFDLRWVLSIGDIKEKSKGSFATIHDKHEVSEQQAKMDFETSCFCKSN